MSTSPRRAPRSRRTLASSLALVLTTGMLFGATPVFAEDAPVDGVPVESAPVEVAVPEIAPVVEPASVPAQAPAPAPAPAPETVAVTFAAPLVEAVTETSVELRWVSPREGAPWTDFDLLVFAGAEPVEAATHDFADDKDRATKQLPFTPVDPETLELGELGVTLTGLTAATDYQFVVRLGERDAADGILSVRTETVRTLDAPVDAEEQATVSSTERSGEPLAAVGPTISATVPQVVAKGGTALKVSWAELHAIASPAAGGYPTYSVKVYEADGTTLVKAQSVNFAGEGIITALTPSTSYVVEVEVTNPEGLGPSGKSASVTTLASSSVPGVIPGLATGQAQSGSSILVSWPAIDEGAEVRTYTVRTYLGDALVATKTGLDPLVNGTSWAVTGLFANTAYTFTVTAIGYDGTGAESERSAPVTTHKGVATAPAKPVLARADTTSTSIVATWEAPTTDGGYPISGYVLEFYNTGNQTATAGLVAEVEVAAGTTSYTLADAMIVGGTISARVSASNAVGASPFSVHSTNLTVAATASPSTAVANAGANAITATDATGDGFTVAWTAPAGATASTGYYARVVEQLPSNVASGANYTVRVIDLGSTGWATAGRLSAAIDGLNGATNYRVAITAYEKIGENRLFRLSSSRSAIITTAGSAVPSRFAGTPAVPVALGVDSISWSGAAFPANYSGGSPVTGYRIDLFEAGTADAVDSVTVQTGPDEAPSYTFTGLDRDTVYFVRFAAINANGEGALSQRSVGVRTLLKPIPGSVAPRYADLAELLAAIKASRVTQITAVSIGLGTAIETNSPVTFTTPWAGEATEGEAWLYPGEGGPAFQSVFTVEDAEAHVAFTLGDLASGTYHLVLYPEGESADKPVAVALGIIKPVTGPTELTDAVFRWGINNESNNGAFFGGCNFFSAGKSPDSGGANVFTASQYSSKEGNVTIVKPNSSGEYVQANWSTKCLTRTGSTVTSSVGTAFTESQVVITGGTGTVDPSTNSAELQWEGSFTVAYYGGMTFWYASNPRLTVTNGVGVVTVTASGYGTDMENQSKWEEIAPREVTLAVLNNVKLTSQGFTVTPDYLGVLSDSQGGAHQPQTALTPQNAAYWGSFPASFIEFQELTGQIAYWYASGGSQDPAKPTLPLTVGYDATTFEEPEPEPGEGTGGGVDSPAAVTPPAPRGGGRTVGLASTTTTAVGDIPTLLQLVEDGVIARIGADAAGIPTSFAIGEPLSFTIPWEGEATAGTIWVYPGPLYAGTFTVVDGKVTVTLDSSIVMAEGETFFTFFGDNGVTITVSSIASSFLRKPASTSASSQTLDGPQQLPTVEVATEGGDYSLLLVIIGGLGLVAVGAVVTTVLVLRRKVVA